MANSTARALSKEEVKKIERQLMMRRWSLRNRCLLHIGITTGFRINELLSLRVKDVFKYGKVLTEVERPKRKMKGKRRGRKKKLFEPVRKLLRKWIKEIKDNYNGTQHTFLFLSREGGAISSSAANQILKRAAIQAEIPINGVSTHALRKTFAARMYDYYYEKAEAGAKIDVMRMLQIELAHADISTTYRYMEFRLETDKPENLFDEYNLSKEVTKADTFGMADDEPESKSA